MLSNTATPKYYGEFRDRVLAGEIPVNEMVSLQMNLIDELIDDPRYYYDDKAIDGWIAYCENEMTLTDGSDVVLLDTFKLWAEDILSWFYFEERSVYVTSPDNHGGHYEYRRIKVRLRNKQYLIVGRSASKSLYNSFIQSFGLTIDKSTTDQIVTAPTMRQAEETTGPIKTAIMRAKGPLFQFLTEGSIYNTTGDRSKRQKLISTKRGIENFLTNSLIEIRPMSVDKLQGLRVKYSTIDEWLSGDTREDVVGAVEQGAAKVMDYLIIATSSEGTVRNGPGDEVKMELEKILRGEYINPHVSIWWYKLDSLEEIEDESMWLKANPNLGVTVSYETYRRDVEKMKAVPSQRNDIIAKRFGIPMEGYTYFFTYEETLPHHRKDFYGCQCSLGADLSQGDDFCAFLFLFPLKGGRFGAKALCFISERTLMKLHPIMRAKYEMFIDEGSLIVLNGSVLEMDQVYEIVADHIAQHDYVPCCFGYDPYNAKSFVKAYTTEFGELGVQKVPQGYKTESVPLGEIKKLTEDRLLLFDQEIMKYAMGNCIVLEDTNGNRKLWKKRYEAKIDPVAALVDAYVAYSDNLNQFE